MSALFSAIIAKAAVAIFSFLLVTSGLTGDRTERSHRPFKVVTAAQEQESTDTTKTAKPAKPVPQAPTESEAVADLPRRPVRACFDTVKDRLGDHPWPSPYVYIGRGNRTARIPKSAWCNPFKINSKC